MQPLFTLSEYDKQLIIGALLPNTYNPYNEYSKFKSYISSAIDNKILPDSIIHFACTIRSERNLEGRHVHVIANCPIDDRLPQLDLDNPVEYKYQNKETFIAEGFLELFAQLQQTPIFSYASRNNGDFFTDVVSFNKFKGKKTGFAAGDLIYHSDRSYHSVRADYVSLLGLIVPDRQLIYTNYIDTKEIKEHLSAKAIEVLSQPIFQTEVDDRSKEANASWESSTIHAILLENDRIRYQDSFTYAVDKTEIKALEYLLELKDAISKSSKLRHMLKKGGATYLWKPNGYT